MALHPTAARWVKGLGTAVGLGGLLAAACSDVQPSAPAVDAADAKAPTELEPKAPDPDRPPRQSLARRIAPLLVPDPPRAPPRRPVAEDPGDGFPRVGIEECDEYLQQYLRCMESMMPKESMEGVREAMAEVAKAWIEVASSPLAIESLRSSCTTTSEATRSSMTAMGCTWE